MSGGALFAANAWLPEGWRKNVLLAWDAGGRLNRVEVGAAPPADAITARGPVIPGMPNLHCHAFQRAMAGLTEYRGASQDDFWTWRDLMYAFARKLTPESMYSIALQLYIEMLKAGYTSVCEFHYIHHDRDGAPYANPSEMAESIIRAAEDAGIGLTLLPVLYQYGGFGEQPLRPEQKRFAGTAEWMLELLARLRREHPPHDGLRYGVAPHSLRAVSRDSLRELIDGGRSMDPEIPVHIHAAEQIAEVEACLAYTGLRPVEWLLDHYEIDRRWCLVHATHMTSAETARLAGTGAVAGLCPTTEANLGDGVFDAVNYFAAGGQWGIGSDSNISVSVSEELKLLEYAQRLRYRSRNVLADPAHPETGERLYSAAVWGGARASGRNIAGLAADQRADFLVLDEQNPSLAMRPPARVLGGFVFSNHGKTAVLDVFSGGKMVVGGRNHRSEETAERGSRASLDRLIDK